MAPMRQSALNLHKIVRQQIGKKYDGSEARNNMIQCSVFHDCWWLKTDCRTRNAVSFV